MRDSRTSDTRRDLMLLLLSHKADGLTLDELAERLAITRNAVRQHITAMERDGLVRHVAMRPTGRRPSRAYGLTQAGGEAFPRQYDRLALQMLESLRATIGDDAVETVLDDMVESLASQWLPELDPLDEEARRQRVVDLMNELGYHAHLDPEAEGVGAVNCVFHNVAAKTRAVCRFDEKLLSRLLGEKVLLQSCMAEGDAECVFSRLVTTSRVAASVGGQSTSSRG